MDEIVIRSMARWPDVPDVYGWLALDRRGNWLVKDAGGGFGRIANAAVCEFIGRNYQHDEAGRWFFQNGPQRVFVKLHYMPLVYRLEQAGGSLRAHTGVLAQTLYAAWLDDAGGLLVQTEAGAGALDDRDLAGALELMRDRDGVIPGEAALSVAAAGGISLCLPPATTPLELGFVATGDAAAHFGFNPEPRPAAGQPDCQ
jgi:hypothetical protein